MLISLYKKKSVDDADDTKIIALFPELCNMTGLIDQMKVDSRVMKDVGAPLNAGDSH